MSTYTKILNEKIIYAASEQIVSCLRTRGFYALRSEREDHFKSQIGFWEGVLIYLKIKPRKKDIYSVEFHKEKRKSEEIRPQGYWCFQRQVETCQNLIKLALASDNGYVRVSSKDIDRFFSYAKREIPKNYECEYPQSILLKDYPDEIIDDETWKKLEDFIEKEKEEGKYPVSSYERYFEK